MKIEKITITSEDIEVLEEALSCSELFWRRLLKEDPEACNDTVYTGNSEDPKT